MELTFDKVKALIALCTFFAGAASYFGYDGFQSKLDVEAGQKQVATIVNYYYEGCK